MAASGLILVTPLMQEALSRATLLAATQFRIARGLQQQFGDLLQLLTAIQAVAEGAEEMQESDPATRLWLQKLNDVVYDMVDLLDECDYYVLDHDQKQVETRSRGKQVRTFFSPSNPDAFGREMAKKFKIINASLSEIRKDLEVIKLIIQFRKQNLATSRPYYERVHLLDSSKVVGRQGDVSKLINLLKDQRSQHPISGISIVGMPGVGKTTVASLVYMKAEEEKLYDLVAWVCASEDFNQQRILGDMLEYFNIRSVRPGELDVLLQDLGKELENKTFLLILDDVWEKDPSKWSDFASLLSKVVKTNGNSIVLTTHSEGVASVVEKQFPICRYDMQRLSGAECWQIIKKAVITRALIPSDVEADGQKIAKQCGGLPLVATAIGGKLLSSGIEADKWLVITANKEWNLEWRNTVLSVLKMSFFNRMPSILKKCFSYCSIFPKGFEISKDDLIQLWMASGFLQQSKESPMTMEEVGNEYFNELVSNSLFQVVRTDACGTVKSCKMYDVLHDLALFVSKDETFIWEIGSNINSKIRNLRINYDGEDLPAIPSDVSQRLHTLFLDCDGSIRMEADGKNLRSLKLVGAPTIMSVSLDKSRHMRYLEIAKSESSPFLESLSKLYMLQTLKVTRCSYLVSLPDDTSKLVSLRHLYFDDENLMPKGIRHLTSLQTLPLFFAGKDEGFMIEELGGLSQLGGKLEIRNLEHVVSKSEANKARLKEKIKLHKLKLVWIAQRWMENRSSQFEEVLEGLEPHSNLKRLTICNYKGERLPSWINGLSSLKTLKIVNWNCSEFPSQLSGPGSCSSLLLLKIVNCNRLRSIPEEYLGSLTCLKELELGSFCPQSKEFPGLASIHHLHSSLEELKLNGWANLKSLPHQLQHLTTLKKLHIGDFGMETLPEWLGDLSSLTSLSIKQCFELKSIPKNCLGRLIRLKELSAGPFNMHLKQFPGFTSIPPSLERLELYGWEELTSLPHQLQHLTALKELKIRGFTRVKAPLEWLGNLSSLRELNIGNCTRLLLPSVEVMRRLSNLQSLIIALGLFGHPWKEQCPEWEKIANIPNIRICVKTVHSQEHYNSILERMDSPLEWKALLGTLLESN